MDRETVKCMCRVAGLLAQIKGKVAEHLLSLSPEAYGEIREMIGDCQEILALRCDAAPITLIAGRVDEVVGNLAFPEKPQPVGT